MVGCRICILTFGLFIGTLCFAQDTATVGHWQFRNSTLDTVFNSNYEIFNQTSPCKTYRITTKVEAFDNTFKSDCILPSKCYKAFKKSFTIHCINDSNLALTDTLHRELRSHWTESFNLYYGNPSQKPYAIEGELICVHCGFLTNDSVQIPVLSLYLREKEVTYLAYDSLFWVIESSDFQCGVSNAEIISEHMSLLQNSKTYTFRSIERELLEVDALLKFE